MTLTLDLDTRQDWGGVVKAGRDRRRTAHQSVRQSNSIRGPIGYPGSLGPRELPRILDGHAAGPDAEQRRNERGEQSEEQERKACLRACDFLGTSSGTCGRLDDTSLR